MALKIELEGCGPGRGRFRVSGTFAEPESVALAIQRNDGRYLGAAEVWQTTAHWHPQYSVQPDGTGLTLAVGSEIIDGVIAVGGIPLRVVMRVDGIENFGILRVKGELIGSGAAAAAAAVGKHDQQWASADSAVDTVSDADTPDADSDRVIDTAPRIDDSRHSGGRTLLLLVLLPVVLAAIGGAWYLGLLDEWLGVEQGELRSEGAVEATSEPEPGPEPALVPTPKSEPESVPEPALSGIALARSILTARPAPDILYAKAEQTEQQKDCAAALVLFNEAADADPRFAAALARRYDPRTFEPGGCIEQPDAPYAIVFFADAAQAGDVAAQRRLGQLMTERERSGATYEGGLEWLRKASESGDGEAGDILKTLGE